MLGHANMRERRLIEPSPTRLTSVHWAQPTACVIKGGKILAEIATIVTPETLLTCIGN
jgi:hypothetical protein